MTLGHVLSWALCGLIIGLIARILVPGPQHLGFLGTILVGVIGAFVGGAIYWGIYHETGDPFSFSGNAWHGWIFSILGAVLVLLLVVWSGLGRSWRRA